MGLLELAVAPGVLGILGDPEEKMDDIDGYPWPGMQARSVDTDGNEVEPDTEGRLQVSVPFLILGYAERLEMTKENLDGPWFHSGNPVRLRL